MREIIADSVHTATAHRVELLIADNADHSNPGTWHVRSRLPASWERTTKTNEARWALVLGSHDRFPVC
jgi:hypothetical protein